MQFKHIIALLLLAPFALAAQYPFTINDYIKQNTNTVTGNDLIYPGDLDNFRGKIQSITQLEFNASKDTAGVVEKRAFNDSHASFTYFFDKEKKIKESWKYAANQTIISKKYFRDFKNDQIDSAKTWTKSGKYISSEKWEYSDQNLPQVRRITMLRETRDFPVSVDKEGDKTNVYVGDYKNIYQNKQLTGRTHIPSGKAYAYTYYDNGILKTKKETDGGKVTKSVEYDKDGNLVASTTFEYDLYGTLVTTTIENNTFESGNRKTESIISVNRPDSSLITIHEVYQYENKNLKYIYRIDKGDKKIFTTYRYNKQGDLIAIESEKTKFTYDYSGYDKQGNWTRGVFMKDGDPIYVWERTIQYY